MNKKENILQGNSYKKAGVDIDSGNVFVEKIKNFASATKRLGTDSSLGGFGAVFDLKACGYKDPLIVSSNDGVGTKLLIAKEMGIHNTIGIDLVAMCVNDIVVQGAEPVVFLDYFATGKLDVDVAVEVMRGISAACVETGCSLSGGETAEMPGVYNNNDYDLGGFAYGLVERGNILPKLDLIKKGDVLIGIESSGVHSNGFSLVRHILKQNNVKLDQVIKEVDDVRTIGEVLLTPTKIYVKPVLRLLINKLNIKAIAHITGGGIVENLPRVLPKNMNFNIDYNSFPVPNIFTYLQKMGNIAPDEMRRVFNLGIGMILVAGQEDADLAMSQLKEDGLLSYIIGNC